MQLVREVETGQWSACAVQRKYKLKGTHTGDAVGFGSMAVADMVKYSRGKADEINGSNAATKPTAPAQGSVADAHMELALEKAFSGGGVVSRWAKRRRAFKKKACWAAGASAPRRARRTPGSKWIADCVWNGRTWTPHKYITPRAEQLRRRPSRDLGLGAGVADAGRQ